MWSDPSDQVLSFEMISSECLGVDTTSGLLFSAIVLVLMGLTSEGAKTRGRGAAPWALGQPLQTERALHAPDLDNNMRQDRPLEV